MVSFFVIEDHSLTNLGIRQLLMEQSGFECMGFAFKTDEAMQKLSELSETNKLPQILILDLFLGEESGIGIMREVCKKFPSMKNTGLFNVCQTRNCLYCPGKRS